MKPRGRVAIFKNFRGVGWGVRVLAAEVSTLCKFTLVKFRLVDNVQGSYWLQLASEFLLFRSNPLSSSLSAWIKGSHIGISYIAFLS